MSIESRLGFGCASLGSRVSARDGLVALERAFDQGITWFDLAPSYGDGDAETIFAKFAGRYSGRLRILTKVGIAPTKSSLGIRMLKPLARHLVNGLPEFRVLAGRARGAATPLPLTGTLIRSSLEASLKRLGVEAVHVCALHDPNPADLARDDVARGLEDIVARGLAQSTGIAGSTEAVAAGLAANLPIRLVQVPDGFGMPGLDWLAPHLRGRSLTRVTHSHLSRSAANLRTLISARKDGPELLVRFGYSEPVEAASRRAALDFAMASNPTGMLLVAAFKANHLHDNLAMLNAGISGDPAALKAALSEAPNQSASA